MSAALHFSATLETESCCNCGILFAMPAEWRRRLLDEGGAFYCPRGHNQFYTETEVQRLKKLVAEKERAVEFQRDQRMLAESLREKAERKLRRVAKGVCPECKRSFDDLRRHMKTKHKEHKP